MKGVYMEKNVTHDFQKKMQSGEKVFGPLIGPGNDPDETVQALKQFGYDFIILDNEHVLINEETVYSYIRAATETGIPVLIRSKDKTAIVRCYLDAGINGLMVPQVNSVEETLHAVNQAYFPPVGYRGYGIGESPYLIDFMSPREHSFLSLTEYVNRNTVVFPMTESLENIGNLARILRLEGVTGTIVGTFDLALSMGGIDPEASPLDVINSKTVEEKLQQVVSICKKIGKVAGIGGFPPEGMAKWARAGYQLFVIGYAIDGNVSSLQPVLEETKSLMRKD
jgi:2-keto-3-deoxy-L-rhamnonate aldolase RhmA